MVAQLVADSVHIRASIEVLRENKERMYCIPEEEVPPRQPSFGHDLATWTKELG
jgi:hypothetical protein